MTTAVKFVAEIALRVNAIGFAGAGVVFRVSTQLRFISALKMTRLKGQALEKPDAIGHTQLVLENVAV